MKIFLSETTRHRDLIFGMYMYHHLVNLSQVCTNYAPVVKNNPVMGSHVLYGLYRYNMNISSCLIPQDIEL